MKKILMTFIMIMFSFLIISCGSEEKTDESETKDIPLISDLKDVEIEVNETYTLKYVLEENPGITLTSNNIEIASVLNGVISGNNEGETEIVLEKDEKKQLLKVNVYPVGALQSSFSFTKERLAGKKIVAFGDSVTANATVGGAKTYYNVFADSFDMKAYHNFAIGGTTATYMYKGSNIYKEYANNTVAIDGVRVVKNAYDANQLKSVDYAFIAYGHNDQYFQPPITVPNDDLYDVNSFDSCHSFKGSYRYMIKTLLLANPNMRIIILGCTYSEYDKSTPSRYGKLYSYADYRIAIKEIAEEFNLTYIDPWDYMFPYFDAYDSKKFYKDTVHLTVEGHKILGKYLAEYR